MAVEKYKTLIKLTIVRCLRYGIRKKKKEKNFNMSEKCV